DPVKNLDAGGDAHQHRRRREKRVAGGRHADREHVMRPHAQADKRDRTRRRDHHAVAENNLAREDRDDLRREAEGRDDEYINFGMAEDPEEVLPQNYGAAGLSVEEVRAEE